MSDQHLPALPRPDFFDHLIPPLSTKREKQLQGVQKRVPKLVRSVQSVGRLLPDSCTIHGPHFISFATGGEKAIFDLDNAEYNKNDPREYFEQCFERERKIGEGSFGEVFRVKSKKDGKYYAVKRTIEPFRNSRDRELKLREVQKHELLPKHPNLVEFKCAWEENGRLYIQTELCEYSLSDHAERCHRIPEKELWGYFADIVAAVHHLHRQDLLHLDIKPENIFVSNNICKLGDFGLVFDLKSDNSKIAQDGDSKYLAREVLNNAPGKPADIFSLGISILELASDLDLPSRGDGWHMLREGRTPEEFMEGISPKLRSLILLMMDLNPEKRPTACELFNDETIQYYLRKRYPLNYSVTRFTNQIWAFLLYFIWVIMLPFCLPVKVFSEWITTSKLLKANSSRFGGQLSSLRADSGNDGSDVSEFEDDSAGQCRDWEYPDTAEPHCDIPLSDKVLESDQKLVHDEDRDSPIQQDSRTSGSESREVTPEGINRSPTVDSSFIAERNGFFLPTSTRSCNNGNFAYPDSPLSSRRVKGFSRKAMTAPARRNSCRYLRYEGLCPIRKLDLSLADVDDEPAQHPAPARPSVDREVANRGSSADELDY